MESRNSESTRIVDIDHKPMVSSNGSGGMTCNKKREARGRMRWFPTGRVDMVACFSETNETSVGMLGRVQCGDGRAWSDFSRLCQQTILSWCRWKNISASDADDLVQDSLVVVIAKIGDFRRTGKGSLRAWLRAIAWRCRSDAVGKVQNVVDLRLLRDRFREASDDIDLLEQEFEKLQQLSHLERCMAIARSRVEPTTWLAFQMQTLEERTGAEVASALGISVDAVHSAKARVLRLIGVEMRRMKALETVSEWQRP